MPTIKIATFADDTALMATDKNLQAAVGRLKEH